MSQAGANNTSGGGGGTLNTLTPDVGGVVTPIAANIDIHGINGIVTSNTGPGSLTISGGVGILQTVSVTLTSTQIKNLATVPITIVPVPGVGAIIITYFVSQKFNYGGTDPFNPVTGNVNLSYYDGVSAFQIVNNITPDPLITASTTQYFPGDLANAAGLYFTPAQIQNLPVVVENLGGGNYTGNAANDNTLTVNVQYVVQSL